MPDKEHASLASVLRDWNTAKLKLADLNKECDRYKDAVERLMDKKGVDSLESGGIKVKRKNIHRSSLSKNDVPKDVWQRYSKQFSYNAYFLSEK